MLFGHPVSHSWSPFIHGMFARQFDHVVDYKVQDVAPDSFRHAVINFFVEGGGGANVTLPHKPAAAEIVNELSARAERARAVNTIVRRSATELYGENTDGVGLVTDLMRNLGVTIGGSRLLILGAGGATRGVLAPLLEQEPREVRIANRTPERATQLAEEFSDLGEISASGFDSVEDRPWDIVINATAASLARRSAGVAAARGRARHRLLRHGLWPRRHGVHALGDRARLAARLQGLGHAGRTGCRVVPAVARRAAGDKVGHGSARPALGFPCGCLQVVVLQRDVVRRGIREERDFLRVERAPLPCRAAGPERARRHLRSRPSPARPRR